jgi:hypothetical protein
MLQSAKTGIASGALGVGPQLLTSEGRKNLGDTAGGFLAGAGTIGSTLLEATPVMALKRAYDNGDLSLGNSAAAEKKTFLGNVRDRNAAIAAGLQSMGADTGSTSFAAGKLGGQIAGTAGVGGALGTLFKGAGASPALLNAMTTSGMRAGTNVAPGFIPAATNMGTRMLGGAITGGASSALVDPESAGTGALIGGALPPALKLSGGSAKLLKNAASGVAKNTLGMTTGAGAETFSAAYRAGKQGGTSFLDNMRGNVPMADVLDSAKDALAKMRIERGNQYRSGMVDIAKDKNVIDFKPIDSAISSLQQMGSFKGQVINKNAAGTVDEISGLVNQWKSLNPAEYHTPEGLDALKKAIGDIRDATQFGTPGRRAADTAYNAVKDQINMQAPTYSKVMNDYSQASETLTEIEKSLSLGNKAAADTSMRKLQSLMRNNVNTNYGNRLELAKTLESRGADILPAVAGQSASSWTPRGLQGLAATGAGMSSIVNPATLAALPFTSPRLMGEAAYGLGAMSRGAGGLLGKVAGPQLLGNSPTGLLDFERFAPVVASAPIFAASQR